jgi:hypothetical protein
MKIVDYIVSEQPSEFLPNAVVVHSMNAYCAEKMAKALAKVIRTVGRIPFDPEKLAYVVKENEGSV